MRLSHSLRESIRATCIFVLIIAGITGIIAWFINNRPAEISWPTRIGSVFVGGIALMTLLAMYSLKPKVSDQLGSLYGPYFECQGFCFIVSTCTESELCHLEVVFQNRHSKACIARIHLRPTQHLFHAQEPVEFNIQVHCPGGSYGRTLVPIPVSNKAQGRSN